VCVAISKIFSVGINIKQLCYLIFASGGKAKVRVVQSIGRGRRLHENKESLFIFDIADQLEYGMEHSSKRNRLYEQEKIPFAYKDIRENTSIVA
jgi:superfamily II DNA or RNA helicase